MCLYIDDELTRKGLKGKVVHSNGMVKVWKVISTSYNKTILYSPIKCGFKWKPGWNKSNRTDMKLTYFESIRKDVRLGIHVFLNKKEAKRFIKHQGCVYYDKVVSVYAYKKDFIAAGSWEGLIVNSAVFTKVFLKKEDHDKALKG